MGSAALYLPAELRFHVSRNVVSPRRLSSVVRDYSFACHSGVVQGRRYANHFPDRDLSRVSLCGLHGMPWRTSADETGGASSHFILSPLIRGRRSRRHLCCHHCPLDFPYILGISTRPLGHRRTTRRYSFS